MIQATLAVFRVIDFVEDVAAVRLERHDRSVKVFNKHIAAGPVASISTARTSGILFDASE